MVLQYGAVVVVVFVSARSDAWLGYAVGVLASALVSWRSYVKLTEMLGQDPLRLAMAKLGVKRAAT
jgi:ABC-type uncharacterized transport system permease subunit